VNDLSAADIEAVQDQLLALAPRIRFEFATLANGTLGEYIAQPEVAGI